MDFNAKGIDVTDEGKGVHDRRGLSSTPRHDGDKENLKDLGQSVDRTTGRGEKEFDSTGQSTNPEGLGVEIQDGVLKLPRAGEVSGPHG